jgi:hypothetical protein
MDSMMDAIKSCNHIKIQQLFDMSLSLVKQSVQEKANNRSALLNIISNIRFLARHGLPRKGADHDKDAIFYQLSNLRCQESTEFEEWLQRKKDKYICMLLQRYRMTFFQLCLIRL